jgi:glycosyltransferase involved in cell wall biosynthesis
MDSRGVDFTLDIIGAGPIEKTLREIVSKANLDDKITFLGKIGRRSLGNYYRRSDLVCVPSLSDPLPTVVLESLLSGVPVLGSNVGGIPYMVETGKNGIIVSHIDVSSIAEAIEKLSQNRDHLRLLAENAHASVYPRFHWQDIGLAISCAVKECLALNGRGLKKN